MMISTRDPRAREGDVGRRACRSRAPRHGKTGRAWQRRVRSGRLAPRVCSREPLSRAQRRIQEADRRTPSDGSPLALGPGSTGSNRVLGLRARDAAHASCARRSDDIDAPSRVGWPYGGWFGFHAPDLVHS